MAKWTKSCKEFKTVRDMIDRWDEDDVNGKAILEELIKICKELAEEKWDDDYWSEEFEDFATKIEEDIDIIETDDEDEIDYYLSEFYDLCDAARVWLDF